MLPLVISLMTLAQTVPPPKPIGPLPSANQLAWHDRQYYAFVHFGPNTFTGLEWGHGTEDPRVFNPTELDARQWVRAFKEAGMTGVILTAKHHDGFALFPSAYTEHSVKASPWKGGKGDVLRELSDACREAGLWLGVYLSPWDRNHPTYGTPEYNDVFVKTLREVLTNYGEVKEVWFDGANGEGPNGKRQVYDWPRFIATVRECAPRAVIFHDGGDVRWVGNEGGYVGETNWSFLPTGIEPGYAGDKTVLYEGDENGTIYAPSECNTSIRPGWFWRASENDKVKSLEQLKEIFYRSTGHGGTSLLNVPPDTRGLIHANDIAALKEFRAWREATFAKDLAFGVAATGVSRGAGFGPERVCDGKADTYWATADGTTGGEVTLDFGRPTTFDHVVLQEHIALGQRVRAFELLADGRPVGKGTTIGYKRIVRFPAARARRLTVRIVDARACPTLSTVSVYLGTPEATIATDGDAFVGETTVTLECTVPGAQVRYTLDGSEPTPSSTRYRGPFLVGKTATVKAAAWFDGRTSFRPATRALRRFETADLWPATTFVRKPDPGLRYTYYERGWQTLDQMKEAVATGSGTSPGFDIGLRKRDDHIAFTFEGVVLAPKDGVYTFFTRSDDGSRLYVDDRQIVENDGLHGMEEKSGSAPLRAGYHRIRVEYFNATGGLGLEVSWQGPGIAKGPIPGENLAR
ncbi:MAG: alpha-L-fucosidase [Fimbriimonadaceae bacterium]|nr:alpha-L-fucosidase [Fimbriimonadaceae bacterium]